VKDSAKVGKVQKKQKIKEKSKKLNSKKASKLVKPEETV